MLVSDGVVDALRLSTLRHDGLPWRSDDDRRRFAVGARLTSSRATTTNS
jgi:hypothetical protein